MSRISRAIVAAGSVLVLAVLALDAAVVYFSLRTITDGNARVDLSRRVIAELERTLSVLKDAETGQRGFLLTGREAYLTPFQTAEAELNETVDRLRALTANDAAQRTRADDLGRLAASKMAELRETIALRREKGFGAALEVVQTDQGRDVMAEARRVAAELRGEEDRLLLARMAASQAAVRRTLVTFAVTTALGAMLVVLVSALGRRELEERERSAAALRKSEAWLATTLASIGDAVIATDGRGHVRFINPVAQGLTGWTSEEAVGRPMDEVFRIINETTRLPADNPVARVLRDGVVVGLANHTLLIARDGTETPIDDSAAPIRGERGEVAGVVLVFRDIAERKRHEAQIDEQRRLAEFGKDVGLALAESPTMEAMLARCAELTVKHLGAAFARLWTPDEAGEALVLRASAGMYTNLDGSHARVPFGRGKIGQIARERRPHLTNDVAGDPQVDARDWAEREGLVAFAGYPLVVGDRLVGVWGMFSRRRLTEAALRAMESVSRAIALGVERKLGEAALAESEAWLATTLSSIGDAVVATDERGRVRFLNPIAEGLTGWGRAEAAGRPIEEVFQIVNEYTREPAEHPVQKVLREGLVVGLANHTVLIAKGGAETPIEDSAAPIRDRQGAVAGVVMVFRDVTEDRAAEILLRASEARKAAILETALDAIITIDGAGRVVEFNPAAERIFGYDRGAAVGRDISELIVPPSLREAHRRGLAHYLASGEGVVLGNRIEISAMRADGTEFPVELAVARISDEGPPLFTAHVRDITDRKRAEEALRERERQFRTLADSIPQLAWMARPDGSIFWYNRRWYDYTGSTPEQMEGWGWQSVHDPAQLPRVLENFKAAIAAGTPWEDTFPLRRYDGAMRSHLSRALPVRDEHGRIVRWFGTNTDISERTQMEEALRASERRYRALIEVSPQMVWEGRPDGGATYFNHWWYEYTGLTTEQSDGEGWMEAIPPEHRERVRVAWLKAAVRGEPFEIETPFRRASDGADRWHLARGATVEGRDGRVARWVWVAVDIHERKQSEIERDRLLEQLDAERRHLKTLIESSRDCVKELDLDGRLVAMSDTGRRLLEIGDLCEVLDKPWLDFWHGADREAARGALAKALTGGAGAFEGFCPTGSGRPKWWDVVVSPILDAQGRPQRLLAVSRDVTERRGHAEERERLLVEAQEANRAKDQFLAVLSHELRTPLNPILLAVTSMLERPTPPDEVRPNLEMIRQNVDLQARLIDDLLDVMRIVRGKMPLHWEVADAHALIAQAVRICRSEVSAKGLGVTLELDAAEHHINADPARLQQVFWNLIKNAVKFTADGGAITIRTRNARDADPSRGRRLVIEFSDTGIGIEPDVLSRIFDPFQQGETSITRRFGGLGLGLAISKGIVEGHGGLLSAESPGRDRGTTFRIELRALPQPEPRGARPPAAPVDDGPPAPSSLAILLLEDEPATMRLMARLLRGLGHDVTAVGTIAEALEAERSTRFDLIISDIGLPDGSGLEMMRQVVARRGPVPAIALTGYGMEEDVQRSREAGFTAHMTKPIDFTKLQSMIRQVAPYGADPTSAPGR